MTKSTFTVPVAGPQLPMQQQQQTQNLLGPKRTQPLLDQVSTKCTTR
eukprot:CAMPEP_0172181132 /NCGR_PEP_ID=MMETSP1050-20130122/17645_1 /TAXON_ID=233186 /ORGANISM="Cryptomonas curvata, Strain CCAP979/52" /LENGTH=46 /DNA_ID= /DNA_START= /DNA_END= /DNA_ORIENTATION=